jgi:hypothetical protein
MSDLAHKRSDGSCPYCGGTSFESRHERRPGQRVDKCHTCDQFSVLNTRNLHRYPLAVPSDAGSAPRV